MTFKRGDIVFHKPTKEKWVLVDDERDGYVVWCGWPPGRARADDCELVEAVVKQEEDSI